MNLKVSLSSPISHSQSVVKLSLHEKIKAVKEGKSCRVTGASLFVNDIFVYSIDVGYVKRQVSSTDVSLSML